MQTQWMVNTHGDPIGTITSLLKAVWTHSDLESMLVSLNGSGTTGGAMARKVRCWHSRSPASC